MKTKDADLQKLCSAASNHFQDVLFSCEELIKTDLKRANEMVADDVKMLLASMESEYAKLLPQKPAFFLQSLEDLEREIREKNHEKAKEIIASIRKY